MKTIATLSAFIMASVLNIIGQDGSGTRSITSDDFASKRPASAEGAVAGKKVTKKASKHASTARAKPPQYAFVRSEKNVSRARPPKAAAAVKGPLRSLDIGVTLWRLRPPHKSEAGAFLLPVLDDDHERTMWLAERVPIDTVFNPGDRLRFAVESSAAGYIYVFGREMYSDGSFGKPYTIFGGSGAEGSVRPGMLFDIPDQQEDLPYLLITPKKVNYIGELLTIIIAPRPTDQLALDKDGKLKNGDNLSQIEFGSEAEVYSRSDAENTIFTKAEADASCGVKTRELVREQPGTDPCAAHARELTREEALPQTIYRIKAQSGKPAVAFVKLTVAGT
jgi:hypothetical protein